jgi:hypothetical protein
MEANNFVFSEAIFPVAKIFVQLTIPSERCIKKRTKKSKHERWEN